jgi:putative sigma-54 modulation protein
MMKCEVTSRNFEIDAKMRDYVDEKIGGLGKYLPRKVRETVSCDVVLEDDVSGREDNRFVCEVVIKVQGTTMVSREGTVSVYAAIDIVAAKLRSQLATYKNKKALEPRRGRMLSQWLGRRNVPTAEPEASPDVSAE